MAGVLRSFQELGPRPCSADRESLHLKMLLHELGRHVAHPKSIIFSRPKLLPVTVQPTWLNCKVKACADDHVLEELAELLRCCGYPKTLS